MEDEEEWMSDTVLINTYSFNQRFSDDIESFLHTDEYIPIRSNSVNAAESLSDLVFEYDVDGVVIQMRRFNAIYTHRPYLNFLPNKKMSLTPVSSLLKKHLNLPQYHSSARQLLKSSVGLKLCADAGFSTMIAVISIIAATTISSNAMADVS
ncbi:hypothetical protein KP79_PYT02951 [Mizuhopecten yessoensis]|uniref:Uncharacterized protein n=1 Tax=Mizuhopecten yessoensis TaxID=6573 RepID=A0A210PJT1_MIZYE|nr:hypothetical protein KP79_PYT02951 [Mizuhopecten yessoensis]